MESLTSPASTSKLSVLLRLLQLLVTPYEMGCFYPDLMYIWKKLMREVFFFTYLFKRLLMADRSFEGLW